MTLQTGEGPNQFDKIEAKMLSSILTLVAEKFQENAIAKGFQTADRNKGEMIALIHSELSEMLEELRKPQPEVSEKIPNFTKLEEETADAFIRLVQFAAALNLRLGAAVVAKHNYNTTRPQKHGKKF